MLKKSVPPFVAQMREMAELFVAEQPELDRMESDLSRLLSQFYIKTADYSLDRWEEDFGLAADPELTLQQRRARVLAKLNSRPPATVRRLENLVRQTMGEENVWIEEHPEDGYFPEAADAVKEETDFISQSYLTQEGVVFYAQPYELGPYAAGYIEVTLTWEQLGL